jgi:hypothetical protein
MDNDSVLVVFRLEYEEADLCESIGKAVKMVEREIISKVLKVK